jgi:hypothetical protein
VTKRLLNTATGLLLITLFGGLVACDVTDLNTVASTNTDESADIQSAESLELSQYYSRVQAGLLTQGLLRQDGGGTDVPFSARNLVDNFVRIAMFDEYTNVGGRIIARQTPSKLDKWQGPIRMAVEFGASVSPAQLAKDRRDIASYSARLSRITGLPIRQIRADANFHIFVVNEDPFC